MSFPTRISTPAGKNSVTPTRYLPFHNEVVKSNSTRGTEITSPLIPRINLYSPVSVKSADVTDVLQTTDCNAPVSRKNVTDFSVPSGRRIVPKDVYGRYPLSTRPIPERSPSVSY